MKRLGPNNIDVRRIVGEISFQSYQRIEADARDLRQRFRSRLDKRTRGRTKVGEITLSEIREGALTLLQECAKKRLPPPPILVRLMRETWLVDQPSPTAKTRATQFAAAVRTEVLGLRFELGKGWKDSKISYNSKIADVALAAGVDRKTVREWRKTPEYAQAFQDAVAQEASESLEAKSKMG